MEWKYSFIVIIQIFSSFHNRNNDKSSSLFKNTFFTFYLFSSQLFVNNLKFVEILLNNWQTIVQHHFATCVFVCMSRQFSSSKKREEMFNSMDDSHHNFSPTDFNLSNHMFHLSVRCVCVAKKTWKRGEKLSQ